ncbi:MAG TPA: hypothetical protein VMV08_07285 [Gaiellaceae bacterium]|nr:hypothetical protein [Gaiellaceae bacterium]
MPVEKQAERLRTPLGKRDRRFLAVLGLVSALAILAGAVYAATRGGDPAGERCFTATYAGPVGGNTVHRCGTAAVYYCRVNAGVPQVAAACRRAGFTVAAIP